MFRLQFDEFQIVSSSHDDTIIVWDFLNYQSNPDTNSSLDTAKIPNALNGAASPNSSTSQNATQASSTISEQLSQRAPVWPLTTTNSLIASQLAAAHTSPTHHSPLGATASPMPTSTQYHQAQNRHNSNNPANGNGSNSNSNKNNSPPSPMEGDD